MKLQRFLLLSCLTVGVKAQDNSIPESCDASTPCTSAGAFCNFEFDTAGGECVSCESSFYDQYPSECISGLYYESGQQACLDKCHTICTSDADCGDNAFCSYNGTSTNSYCVSCEQVDQLTFCNVQDRLVYTPEAKEACLNKCHTSCSSDDACGDKSFCDYGVSDSGNGYCRECGTEFNTDPVMCFWQQGAGAQGATCASTCFSSCSDEAGNDCSSDSFCASSNEYAGGYCMECADIYENPSNCFERNTTDANKQLCADTCFGTCSADQPCPEGKHCDFSNGQDGYCLECPDYASRCTDFEGMKQDTCVKSCFDTCDTATNKTCPVTSNGDNPFLLFCDFQLSDTEGACEECPGNYESPGLICTTRFETSVYPPKSSESCYDTCYVECDSNLPTPDPTCPSGTYCSSSDGGAYCRAGQALDPSAAMTTKGLVWYWAVATFMVFSLLG